MARFSDADIAGAVAAFAAATPAREAPAVGKNSTVTIYGENPNVYKPIIEKVIQDEPDEKVSPEDIGTELGGLE